MTDALVRELERAAKVAPDDAAARLRLVSALARTGRRADALKAIDLATVRDDAFLEAKRLADELWREELLSLEQVVKVPGGAVTEIAVDPSGALLAWGAFTGLRIAELPSGEILHKDSRFRVAPDGIHVAGGKVFARRVGAPLESPERITCFSRIGDGMKAVWKPVSPSTRLLGVSPAGDRLLMQDEEVEGVYEWPSLEPVRERPCSAHPPIVDWDTGHLLSFELGARTIEVFPLNGGRRTGIQLGAPGAPLEDLGRGVVAERSPGLTLHGLGMGWKLRVIASQEKVPTPSLSRDGRGLRIALRGTTIRFEVDLEKGELRSGPAEIARRDPRKDSESLWHPEADVVFQRKGDRKGDGNFFELRSLDGTALRTLPSGVVPHRWTDDGHGLIVQRGAGDGECWLELWRARETHGS